jgi:hypothetical protein
MYRTTRQGSEVVLKNRLPGATKTPHLNCLNYLNYLPNYLPKEPPGPSKGPPGTPPYHAPYPNYLKQKTKLLAYL